MVRSKGGVDGPGSLVLRVLTSQMSRQPVVSVPRGCWRPGGVGSREEVMV